MIKLSQTIPDTPPPTDDPKMTEYLVAIKQCVDELARKAKSIQTEVRTTAVPSVVTDFETEGEEVRTDIAGVRRAYQLLNGSIRYHVET